MSPNSCFLCTHSDVPNHLWDLESLKFLSAGDLCQHHKDFAIQKIKELNKKVYVLKTAPTDTETKTATFVPKPVTNVKKDWNDTERDPGQEG